MIFPYNFISGFLSWTITTIAGYFSLSTCVRAGVENRSLGALGSLLKKNRNLREKTRRSLRKNRVFPVFPIPQRPQVLMVIFQVVRTAMTIELLFAANRKRKVKVNMSPEAKMKQKYVEIKVCIIIFIITKNILYKIWKYLHQKLQKVSNSHTSSIFIMGNLNFFITTLPGACFLCGFFNQNGWKFGFGCLKDYEAQIFSFVSYGISEIRWKFFETSSENFVIVKFIKFKFFKSRLYSVVSWLVTFQFFENSVVV